MHKAALPRLLHRERWVQVNHCIFNPFHTTHTLLTRADVFSIGRRGHTRWLSAWVAEAILVWPTRYRFFLTHHLEFFRIFPRIFQDHPKEDPICVQRRSQVQEGGWDRPQVTRILPVGNINLPVRLTTRWWISGMYTDLNSFSFSDAAGRKRGPPTRGGGNKKVARIQLFIVLLCHLSDWIYVDGDYKLFCPPSVLRTWYRLQPPWSSLSNGLFRIFLDIELVLC